MTATAHLSTYRVDLTHTFNAQRDRLFKAWTDPRQFIVWFNPPGYKDPAAELDVRVGGIYRLTLHPPKEAIAYNIYGEFREVRPPEKLSFTWAFDPPRSSPVRGSLVTVEFKERGPMTELHLRHEALPSEEERQDHTEGWKRCLTQLEAYLGAK